MSGEGKGVAACWWVGCGCLLAVLLVVVAFGAFGFLGISAMKGYVENVSDPEVRERKARELLGTAVLPEGYTAHFYLDVPLLMEMVLLSDAIPPPEAEIGHRSLGDHAFFYLALRDLEGEGDELRRYFDGEVPSASFFDKIDLDVRSQEVLGRGDFELPPQELRWVAHRGELESEAGLTEGIYSLVLIECPSRSRVRLGVWFRKLGDETPPETLEELAGTPADPDALRAFMSHFNVCG